MGPSHRTGRHIQFIFGPGFSLAARTLEFHHPGHAYIGDLPEDRTVFFPTSRPVDPKRTVAVAGFDPAISDEARVVAVEAPKATQIATLIDEGKLDEARAALMLLFGWSSPKLDESMPLNYPNPQLWELYRSKGFVQPLDASSVRLNLDPRTIAYLEKYGKLPRISDVIEVGVFPTKDSESRRALRDLRLKIAQAGWVMKGDQGLLNQKISNLFDPNSLAVKFLSHGKVEDFGQLRTTSVEALRRKAAVYFSRNFDRRQATKSMIIIEGMLKSVGLDWVSPLDGPH